MASLTSRLIVELLDRVSAPARKVGESIKGITERVGESGQQAADFGTRIDAAMARNERSLRQARGAMADAAAMGYVLYRGLSAPIGAAAGFQKSMNRVKALSNATEDQMTSLSEQARELGRTTMYSASQAADAMGFLAMAGFEVDDVLASMPGTLELAAAGQVELARAADIASNVLSAYGMEASEISRVNDVLAATFTRTNTDLNQLAEAMRYAAPVAASAGVRFEEAAAAIGLMGNAGIQGSMAGTSLRGAIARMLSPTRSASDAMAELGMSTAEIAEVIDDFDGSAGDVSETMAEAGLSFTNAEGRLLSLGEIIQQLEPHAENTSLMLELFGQRAGPAMATLVSQGADALDDLTEGLQNSAGTAKRIAQTQMEGFEGQMMAFRSAVEGLNIAIGNALLPTLTRMAEAVTAALGPITRIAEKFPKVTSSVVGATASVIGFRVAAASLRYIGLVGKGGVLSMIATGFRGIRFAVPMMARAGIALKGFGVVLAGLKAPLALLIAGGLLIRRYWDRISAVLDGVAEAIGDLLRPALDWLGAHLGVLSPVVDAFAAAWGKVRDVLSGLADWVSSRFSGLFGREVLSEGEADDIAERARVVTDRIIRGFAAIPHRILELRGAMVDAGAALIQSLWDGAVETFNRFLGWVRQIPARIREAIGNINLSGIISWPERPSWLGGSGGSANPNAGPGGISQRARGGPISRGQRYLVGEDGPELITASRSGYVHPTGTGPAARAIEVTVNPAITINAGGGDPAAIAREVHALFEQRTRALFRGVFADTGVRMV